MPKHIISIQTETTDFEVVVGELFGFKLPEEHREALRKIHVVDPSKNLFKTITDRVILMLRHIALEIEPLNVAELKDSAIFENLVIKRRLMKHRNFDQSSVVNPKVTRFWTELGDEYLKPCRNFSLVNSKEKARAAYLALLKTCLQESFLSVVSEKALENFISLSAILDTYPSLVMATELQYCFEDGSYSWITESPTKPSTQIRIDGVFEPGIMKTDKLIYVMSY